MSTLVALLNLFLLAHLFLMAEGDPQEQDDYAKNCQIISNCSGLEIRYSYRLKSSPAYCGAPGMELSCDGGETARLTFPNAKSYKVIAIDYREAVVTIQLPDSYAECPLRNLSADNLFTAVYDDLNTSVYELQQWNWGVSLLNCSTEFKPKDGQRITGPVKCLAGSEGHFVYAASDDDSLNELPPDCFLISSGGLISRGVTGQDFKDAMDDFIQKREVSLGWRFIGTIGVECQSCERNVELCSRFNDTAAKCVRRKRHRPNVGRIVGPCVVGLLIAVAAAVVLLYTLRRLDDEEAARLKVERFLATYTTTKPTRYTFAELKKMTKRFKHRLGQGGYGSVYRGELLNGIPVAVKMLENSKGEGEEFINEVATIGRIHHINIVRLLGFCSEKSRRALVYEFMPGKSLDKCIFSQDPKEARKPLRVEKMMDIAIGIARGIEYLHQGCDQRILHFDIKPHNILLDYELKPKISDFGLAKLCSKDQSIVTMTAARGTRGYIAPEMYSRNFGTVSYKSDVYSFGMLLLEMIGGKKIADPETGNQIESYFPEWVYDQLVAIDDRNQELTSEMNEKEAEIMRKLATVSLWCIQWSPNDRPSMSRVLQMLIGDQTHSLPIPPKPFVSTIENDGQPS